MLFTVFRLYYTVIILFKWFEKETMDVSALFSNIVNYMKIYIINLNSRQYLASQITCVSVIQPK